ncbi:hypothetical protein [Aquibacillus kalidii]|uniref:hypothetical protein n=1 Tax=Aquibacillus kalidii TaxID=2762597 RepID=UPI001644C877|nr:hypothetical protein [Aquibacillus kalidii]
MHEKDGFELKKSFKNVSILFFLVVFLLLLLVILINVLFGIYSWQKLYIDIINSLVGVLVPLVLFNFLYDHFTKKQHDRELSEKITETMMLDQEIINNFSTDSKKDFIRKSTQSILGDTVGQMLYDSLIKSYLNKTYEYRHHFKYYISYSETTAIDPVVISDQVEFEFSNKDYYWVRQELSFLRDLSKFNEIKDVRIGFSYKESTLDGLYNRVEFLFRENLWISNYHNELLKGLTNGELTIFVEEVLKLSIEIGGQVIPFRVINNGGHEGFHLLLELPSDLPNNQLSSVKLKFQMPQLKTQKKFIVVISEPTENVEIMLMHLEDKVQVEAIPFLNEAESITRLPNDTIKIDIDDWVLPRAGVVFVWDDKIDNSSTN